MKLRAKTRRALLDWGMCHKLLDALGIAPDEPDLAPRVRVIIKLLVRQVGWPSGKEPAVWWEPIESTDDPNHRRKLHRKKFESERPRAGKSTSVGKRPTK